MTQNSRMNITGKNFLFALLIALIITLAITMIYLLMSLFLSLNGKEKVDITEAMNILRQMFLPIFQTIGICVAPIVFLLTFALLQRIRIKF